MTVSPANDERFWDLAEEFLARPGVTKSTMMGFPCLCVDELVAADRALPFAPAGRRFREWATVPKHRSRTWRRLLDEALAFVTEQPAPKQRRR